MTRGAWTAPPVGIQGAAGDGTIHADAPEAGIIGTIRTAVVGMSNTPICGGRDHATLLAKALADENVSCSMHWLARSEQSLRASRSEIRSWTHELSNELERTDPQAILLHYSTFAYSHRGVPVFVRPALTALRRSSRAPVITVMHEYAYPWRAGDWRGNLWALSQRVVLVDVIRASSATVATTDFRAEWFASTWWIPRRPVAVAPVFSNLPPASPGRRRHRTSKTIGLFGYSYEGTAASLVLDTMRILLDAGLDVQLRLLGAPGPSSPAGQSWAHQASVRNMADVLSFTGTLPARDLSNALGECDVLLSADPPGPTSRKGTLAGSLASGAPVVAIDGPRRWSELIEAEAALVVEPTAEALADAVRSVLADTDLGAQLGARGRAFAEQRMGVAHSAQIVARLLRKVLGERSSTAC